MRRPLAQTSVRDALDSAVIALTAAGCETPRLDAELLLAAAMGVDRAAIVADPARPIEPDAARRFMEYAARRREREPVAYILGVKGFRSIELAVDPRVLIPRPETEHLVDAVLDLPSGARVCDVGTGSGAIALALKSERPDLRVVATDASADALEVAGANARRLGLDVELHHGDLLADVRGPLDVIVSNPPYVEDGAELAPEIVRYEPALALRAGPDGLDVIRRLLPAAGATEATVVALEIGAGQAGAVGALMREAGFGDVDVVRDLAGHERVLVGRRR
jgi:release factor glutamine methyltransferase